MASHKVVLITAAALASAGSLVACSSSDDSTSSEAAASQSATEEETSSVEEEADPSSTDDASTDDASEAESSSSTVSVVSTTTMLGSVVGDIVACASPNSTAITLMPVGADPHDFSPSSAEVADMVTSDLVVANGLMLEEGLEDALENAASDGATVLEVAPLLDPIPFGGKHGDEDGDEDGHDDEHGDDHGDDHGDEEGGEDGHAHGSEDPHFWFDMNRMATAAEIIGAELAEDNGDVFAECGSKIADEIRSAEQDVRKLLESVPADQRILVTDHDALGYLADVYGYEIAGTVIPSGTTLAEPSSADLVELVDVIEDEGVQVIFANTADPTTLADAVAAEAGTDVQVVTLFVGSLGGPGSGAEDYVSMMLTNAELISGALNAT
ncbi:MAG: metal ABC transporter substrate-binding protein [Actinomycetota bacterium]